MAQYHIPDPEEEIPCPYDKVHMVRAKRMQYHLMKCRKNYAGKDFATCPFNARHEMPKPELRYHVANCPDRVLIEPMLEYENEKKSGEEGKLFKGCTDLPVYENMNIQSEENWDAEIPSVARIGVDPSYFARLEHTTIPGLKPSEKKQLKEQLNYARDERKFLEHNGYDEEDDEKEEEQKLRLPRTAAHTYIPKEPRNAQQPCSVFAYSLSMAGVGRGLPANNTNMNNIGGRGRGRGIMNNENRQMPVGRGLTIQEQEVKPTPSYQAGKSPVFNVGIGRGIMNGSTAAPAFIVPNIKKSEAEDNQLEKQKPTNEDVGKQIKKIQKKLRQIQVLEEKAQLTPEERAKVDMKEELKTELEMLMADITGDED